MDPVTGEQLDYGDGDYAGNQRMQYHQGGAIPALAEEEMIGEDDEYDDLYNDVNVGEGFLQMQRSETQAPPVVASTGFQSSKDNVSGTRVEAAASQEVNNEGVANEGNYAAASVQFPEQKSNLPASGGPAQIMDAFQRGRLPEMANKSQAAHLGYQGSASTPHKIAADPMNSSEKVINEPAPMMYPNMGNAKGVPQIPPNQMNSNANVNVNHSMDDEYMGRPSVENGNTMLFVGELHWWTTDSEIESVLIQYGKVKEIKFFDERSCGKSKGYCQVEFYDSAAAFSCKEGMNGHIFNGRACVVAFATPQTIRQMGASYTNKTQGQAQSQVQGRNPVNDAAGRGNGANYPSGDTGRNFGRGGWARGNQAPNRGPGSGPMRGRGGMVNTNMMGNAPGAGGVSGGGTYGQGITGPGFGGPPGMMPPEGMMGPGFDLAFMGRGTGYGGFSGPGGFPGMLPPFQSVNSMGLPGVAPHVNPAFFGRGMNPNGMSMMGTAGIVGPHSGMWNETNMGGWGGEEHGRESSYGGEDNASEYGYEEASYDKGVRSSAASREKERNSDRDGSSVPEKRHREDRERVGERYDRNSRHREEKDRYRDYRHKDRESGYDDDWDKGQSSRSRSRSGAVPENDHRSRSRDADYGKRRRMPSE
ncbi:cleavage and polyadenylation specificity factor subunit 6-like [Salvia divinorum]|uniref:Cleavage and polyadenylation specificity factor subunit 6-like n=1 Tax=Salvia divinorum TaxID=28513 RepID=A0ABD1ICL8_SALDI